MLTPISSVAGGLFSIYLPPQGSILAPFVIYASALKTTPQLTHLPGGLVKEAVNSGSKYHITEYGNKSVSLLLINTYTHSRTLYSLSVHLGLVDDDFGFGTFQENLHIIVVFVGFLGYLGQVLT